MIGPVHRLAPVLVPTTPDEVDTYLDGNAPGVAATVHQIALERGGDVAARLELILRSPYAADVSPYCTRRCLDLARHKRADVRAAWRAWISREVDRAIAMIGGAPITRETPGAGTPEASHSRLKRSHEC